jgi:hypothetical protein
MRSELTFEACWLVSNDVVIAGECVAEQPAKKTPNATTMNLAKPAKAVCFLLTLVDTNKLIAIS